MTSSVGAWTCQSCGADNTPEHCMGGADLDGFNGLDFPRCGVGADGVCTCSCEDCNPQSCRKCGDDL